MDSNAQSIKLKKFFAKKLKNLREKKGLSQAKLAEELGVSHGSVSYYENADRMAGIDFIYKAAQYFDCSTDYLLGLNKFKNIEEQKNLEQVELYIAEQIHSLPHNIRGTLITALAGFIEADYKASKKQDEKQYNSPYIKKLSEILCEYSVLINSSTFSYNKKFEENICDMDLNANEYLAKCIKLTNEYIKNIKEANDDLVSDIFDNAIINILECQK